MATPKPVLVVRWPHDVFIVGDDHITQSGTEVASKARADEIIGIAASAGVLVEKFETTPVVNEQEGTA